MLGAVGAGAGAGAGVGVGVGATSGIDGAAAAEGSETGDLSNGDPHSGQKRKLPGTVAPQEPHPTASGAEGGGGSAVPHPRQNLKSFSFSRLQFGQMITVPSSDVLRCVYSRT